MTNKNFLQSDPFDDVIFSDKFDAHPGVFTPYEYYFMYPSGMLPL